MRTHGQLDPTLLLLLLLLFLLLGRPRVATCPPPGDPRSRVIAQV